MNTPRTIHDLNFSAAVAASFNHGLGRNAFVYVADSAFVTGDNLKKAGDDIKFLSRLPAERSFFQVISFVSSSYCGPAPVDSFDPVAPKGLE